MKFVAARCPSCNGDLQVSDDRDFGDAMIKRDEDFAKFFFTEKYLI